MAKRTLQEAIALHQADLHNWDKTKPCAKCGAVVLAVSVLRADDELCMTCAAGSYRIAAAYELASVPECEPMDELLEFLAGQQFENCGTGLGMRDLEFFYDSKDEALAAVQRFRVAIDAGLKITVTTNAT